MESALWQELESFVRTETGISRKAVLTAETRLTDDLDLTGDDAEEFMEKFFIRFRVELGDFQFDRYFVGEGSGLILLLLTLLSRKRREALTRVPLTLGMLLNAAGMGRWESAKLEQSI